VAREGAYQALDICATAGLPMAIVSSSPLALIWCVLDKLAIRPYFTVVQSAEHEPFGKPHPGVYIATARRLGVRPDQCLAFEDSPNGVLAARAAKMTCIAVPDEALRQHRAFCIADRVLHSLAQFDANMLAELS
jgi:sugar-phosphatase